MEIMEILDKINKDYKTTILMVTHDIDIVKRMKKRVIVLKEGRMIKDYKEGKFVDEKL
jgi:cell division transport system ATP-binding protein